MMFISFTNKKRFTVYFSLAAFLLFPVPGIAQPQNFHFANYGVKDGMSHGIVNDLFRDSEGFLWISTYNGLDRFDGTNFKIFHADYHNPNAIANDYVQQVCEDHQGNIWAGCDKGVSCYNKTSGKFKNYHLSNPNGSTIEANAVFNILCDRHGTIWCSSGAGIFEYDVKLDKFTGYFHNESDPASISSDRVFKNSFVEDPVKDGIWISGPNGINFLDLKTKAFYNYRNNPGHDSLFTNNEIYPLAFDQNKNLWFSIRFKPDLYCYNFSNKSLVKEKIQTNENNEQAPFNIATLFFDSKGNTWFSTWSTKIYFKAKNEKVFSHLLHNDLNPNSINSGFFWDVIEDRDGSLWFGGVNGISKFQPSAQFYSLRKPNESLPINDRFKTINAMLQQNDSLVWLGTNQGLYSYNFQTGDCKKITTLADNNFFINYVRKIEDKLWLVGETKIYVFDPNTKKILDIDPLPKELQKNPKYISQIVSCRNGNIWLLAGKDDLLYCFKKNNNEWVSYKHDDNDPHSPPLRMVSGMYEDADDTMWFGCLQDGLMYFDNKKNQFNFLHNANTGSAKIPLFNVGKILAINKNELYLMPFRTGLIKLRYADSSAVLYKQSDGLATESNFDMAVDHDNNIWLAGYQDVTEFNPQQNSFTRFHIDYANDNYLYSNIVIALNDGSIAVSIMDAIAVYKHNITVNDNSTPHVIISDFSVFEQSIPYTQKNPGINLSYKQNFFSLNFSSFSNSRDPLQYAYKLENFDKDWVYSGRRQFASYTNVPGGDYTFLVKASGANGKWSEPTIVHIFISPPFWETYWFRGIIAALLIFAVIVIFKIRERNYRAKQEQKLQVLKVRDRIAQDLHDDIGASLSSIRMYSEAVRMQVKEKLPQADRILERISENSKEIVDNMSDIVWAINPKNDSLQFMEDRMHSFISAVCSSKNIIAHFNQIDFHELKLPMETRKNIFLIFKEAVNNAAKYSECKNIYINIEKDHSKFCLTIKDDGKGFDIDNSKNGNGLHNMQKRTQELNGKIDIESNFNEGTNIKLTVPLTNANSIPSNGE